MATEKVAEKSGEKGKAGLGPADVEDHAGKGQRQRDPHGAPQRRLLYRRRVGVAMKHAEVHREDEQHAGVERDPKPDADVDSVVHKASQAVRRAQKETTTANVVVVSPLLRSTRRLLRPRNDGWSTGA